MKTFERKTNYIDALKEYFNKNINKLDAWASLAEAAIELNLATALNEKGLTAKEDENARVKFITPTTVEQAEQLANLIDEYCNKKFGYRLWNSTKNQFELFEYYDWDNPDEMDLIEDLLKNQRETIDFGDGYLHNYETDFEKENKYEEKMLNLFNQTNKFFNNEWIQLSSGLLKKIKNDLNYSQIFIATFTYRYTKVVDMNNSILLEVNTKNHTYTEFLNQIKKLGEK